MIHRYRLHKDFSLRPGLPGRGEHRIVRGSDIVLMMMIGLLVLVAAIKILQG